MTKQEESNNAPEAPNTPLTEVLSTETVKTLPEVEERATDRSFGV